MRGALAAAKARAKRENNVLQSDLQKRKGQQGPPALILKAGVMLVQDWDARRKAHLLRFALVSDPLDFVAQVIKFPAAKKKGHVVIASLANTDYSLSATIAAALLGCFWATPTDFLREDETQRGLTYKQAYNNPKRCFHVAVSAALAGELPTLPLLLGAIAVAPGSCLKYFLSERKLIHSFRKTIKTASKRQEAIIQQTTCVLSKQGDHENVKAKFKVLYINPRTFLFRFYGSPCEAFPGEPER